MYSAELDLRIREFQAILTETMADTHENEGRLNKAEARAELLVATAKRVLPAEDSLLHKILAIKQEWNKKSEFSYRKYRLVEDLSEESMGEMVERARMEPFQALLSITELLFDNPTRLLDDAIRKAYDVIDRHKRNWNEPQLNEDMGVLRYACTNFTSPPIQSQEYSKNNARIECLRVIRLSEFERTVHDARIDWLRFFVDELSRLQLADMAKRTFQGEWRNTLNAIELGLLYSESTYNSVLGGIREQIDARKPDTRRIGEDIKLLQEFAKNLKIPLPRRREPTRRAERESSDRKERGAMAVKSITGSRRDGAVIRNPRVAREAIIWAFSGQISWPAAIALNRKMGRRFR